MNTTIDIHQYCITIDEDTQSITKEEWIVQKYPALSSSVATTGNDVNTKYIIKDDEGNEIPLILWEPSQLKVNDNNKVKVDKKEDGDGDGDDSDDELDVLDMDMFNYYHPTTNTTRVT